jgi:drug/metabolite transporter (DMT)-like permease
MMIVHEVDAANRGIAAVVTGTVLTLAGVLSASTANVMQGSQFARRQSMFVMIAWAMAFGTVANAGFALVTVGAPVWDPRPAYLVGVLYLGVVGSAVTFPLYFGIIRAVGPGPAAWSSVLIPIIAMGFSTVVEGYVWAPLSIIGGLVALVGMVIALRR